MSEKIIFVTGGSISGLWKWVTASSVWKLLKSAWFSIWMIKMDQYLQVDAGTISPYEHWEVFVTEDWTESDLDLWNYERFTDENLSSDNYLTTWRIYLKVINKERKWEYLWQTVQVIPHVTNEIKDNILKIASKKDFTIVEVWWTVWDIEWQHFLESIRQLKNELWKNNVMYLHVVPLLYLNLSWEVKTKLIQHSVMKLREYGIFPDMLICRTQVDIEENIKKKLCMFCEVTISNIIEAKDAKSIYMVPELFRKQNVDTIILEHFRIKDKKADLSKWNKLVNKITETKKEITIWVIWKYVETEDAYKSVNEAFIHAWVANNVKVKLNWINSEELENENYENILNQHYKQNKLSWVLIPWGFWNRWIEWKINAVKFARENNIPFLWICLWLQIAVIEFARNVCNIEKANSTEFDSSTKNPVVDFMQWQEENMDKWWTMRLWNYDAVLKEWSLANKLYLETNISERHRHRYEVNPKFHNILEENGLTLSGTSPDGKLVEFIEIKNHPYFIATQAHPEFKSRLENPHPLFVGLVRESLKIEV